MDGNILQERIYLYIKYGFGYVFLGADLLSKKETSQLISIYTIKINSFIWANIVVFSHSVFYDVLRGLKSCLLK